MGQRLPSTVVPPRNSIWALITRIFCLRVSGGEQIRWRDIPPKLSRSAERRRRKAAAQMPRAVLQSRSEKPGFLRPTGFSGGTPVLSEQHRNRGAEFSAWFRTRCLDATGSLLFHRKKSTLLPQGARLTPLVATVLKHRLAERASCFGADWPREGPSAGSGR